MSQVTETVTEPEIHVGVEVSAAVIGRSPWELFWRRFRKDRVALVGAGFIVLLVLLAIAAPLIARVIVHHGPNDLHQDLTAVGPSGNYWFGVDTLGRDVFVRTIYGARTSLTVAFFATGLAVAIGILLGTMAGFFGGWVDTVVSRAIDIVLSLPSLLLAIGITAACGITAKGCLGGLIQPGVALVGWPSSACSAGPFSAVSSGGRVLSIREKEFIEASRSVGFTNTGIMFREILPNLAAPVIVYATLIIPYNILFEASLSFLGVGIPPTTPSWGAMISDAAGGELYQAAWWMLFFPGMALVLTTLSFNLVGDGLRDALDPRMGG